MVDMSTIHALETIAPIPCDPQGLISLLDTLESHPLLFQQDSLRERLLALDELDGALGGSEMVLSEDPNFAEIYRRTLALQCRLDSANAQLYAFLRFKILHGERKIILHWLKDLAPDEESTGPRPGLGFDVRDDFIAGIFQQSEPREVSSLESREMVTYQPTPVRHVLDLLKLVPLSGNDLFIDLGSGLGHVPLLVSMLAGVRSRGIEIEPAYVAEAKESAQALHIENTSFVAADAREADLSNGTVFYLYSPFTGSILDQVLGHLWKQSRTRPIKLCSLGPCTRRLEEESWLKVHGAPDPNRVTLFESR